MKPGKNGAPSQRELWNLTGPVAAAGLAYIIGRHIRRDQPTTSDLPPEPVPVDAPEPPDMSGVESKLDDVVDVLTHIAAQNTPPTPPPRARPRSYLSLSADEIDARRDPNPELTTALNKLSEKENDMARLDIGQDRDSNYRGGVPYYTTKLSAESQSYVKILLSDEVQNNPEAVTIGSQGMRLIEQSLKGDIAPTPEDLAKLSKIMQQQINRPHDPVNPANPMVKRIVDRLNLESWKLDLDEIARLEGIINLDHLAGKITLPSPKQGFYERFKRGSSRHVKSKKVPNMTEQGVLSHEVAVWWQHSNERNRVTASMVKGTKKTFQEYKLECAQQDAQRRLDLHYAALQTV